MNQIVLLGRLTRDPELRHTQTGTAVCSFTIAVDRPTKNEDGSRQVDFLDCVAWRGTAEFASKYFSKGQSAAVSGRLQIRDWTDKDGNKRRNAEIIVDNIYFAGEKKQGGEGFKTPLSGSDFAELEDDDGDLPFD